MNLDRRLFRDKRMELLLELGLHKSRLDEPHLETFVNSMVIRQRWLIRQFRRLVRAGRRWEAEQRFLWGIDQLRREAFDRVVNNKITRAKIHEVCHCARTGEGLREVDETGIREDTVTEVHDTLREMTRTSPIPVW